MRPQVPGAEVQRAVLAVEQERIGVQVLEQDGRLALIAFALIVGTSPLANRIQRGAAWVTPAHVLVVVLALVAVVAFFTKSHGRRAVLGVTCAALSVYGVFFVWSQPGVG